MKSPMWRRYVRFWGADVSADVDDELAFHIELRVAELVAHGMAPSPAREEALRRAGDIAALSQACRVIGEEHMSGVRRREWFDVIRSDARIGVRQFVRDPLLALVAAVTLALGIGATTGIFSIVYAVLLRPLPFADADRMTLMTETQRGSDQQVGPGQFTEWVKRQRAFESVAAYLTTAVNLTDGAPERVPAAFVTPGFFQTRYLPPEHGRYFLPEESEPGRDGVVVLSHALFMQRFGGDRSIVGRTIRMDDVPVTVVGVAPAGYSLVLNRDLLWRPLALTSQHKQQFGDHWLAVLGKRRAGVSLAEAQQDLERVSREIAELHPNEMVDRSARVHDFHANLVSGYDRQLTVLFGAVGFVLLLSCLNVANLLLARVMGRRKEIAIRAALGAGKSHIVRQFLVESMVLALAGGVLALGVAQATIALLLRIAPAGVPGLEHAGSAPQLLAFLALVTLASGAFLGVLPALRGLRAIQPALRTGGRTSGAVSTRDPLRSALVIAEIALALVLLCGAGLFVRSALNLQRIDPGFDTANLVTVRLALASAKYATPEQVISGYTDLLERVRALPHVRAATLNSSPPLSGGTPDVAVYLDGRVPLPGQQPFAQFQTVTPGYFETMGVPMRSGRALAADDRANTLPVVVVSETAARGLWPDENPIGKRLACCAPDSMRVWREVVGVSRDVRHFLTNEPLPDMFVPIEQVPPVSWIWFANSLALVIRTDGQTESVLQSVRQTLNGFDPTLPLFGVSTFDELLSRATASNRFSLLLLSSLALLALVLAAVGIYGVLAYFVGQRTSEIGVRVALGARRGDVLAMVLRQGAVLTGAGLTIGLAIALVMSRTLRTLLYEIEPTDLVTYFAVAITLGGVSLAACYVPARRAASVDPAITLRG